MDLAYDPGISEVGLELFTYSTSTLSSLSLLNSQIDQKKIDVLDWLLYEESHREEALRQSNALIREFLGIEIASAVEC